MTVDQYVPVKDRIEDFNEFVRRDDLKPTEHMLIQTIAALSVLEPHRNKTPEEIWNEQRAMTIEIAFETERI